MSHIILALVYYIVLTPIGVFMRMLGKEPLSLRFDRNAESYWIKRQKGLNDKTSYEKMY
jgi:hypothetical protein